MKSSVRPIVVCALFTSTLGISNNVFSQSEYPVKPVTVVAAVAPGGPADAEGRLYVSKMQGFLGQAFVLDFKPGATGTIGAAYVARAAPDGYTLLMVTSGFTIYPLAYRNLPFDTLTDFSPLTLMSKKPTVLVVNPAFPPRDTKEYLAYARANPGKISFGTTGTGSSNHLVGAWMHSTSKTKVTFVPYKGMGQILPDLMAGRLDVTSAILSGVLPLIKSGKIRAIGMSGDRRSSVLPDVATVAESGLPGHDASYWFGFSAPAATPAAIVNKLSQAFVKVVHLPDITASLEASGAVGIGSTPEQFKQLLISETALWRTVVRESEIKFED